VIVCKQWHSICGIIVKHIHHLYESHSLWNIIIVAQCTCVLFSTYLSKKEHLILGPPSISNINPEYSDILLQLFLYRITLSHIGLHFLYKIMIPYVGSHFLHRITISFMHFILHSFPNIELSSLFESL
jgi:hypothetical protein